MKHNPTCASGQGKVFVFLLHGYCGKKSWRIGFSYLYHTDPPPSPLNSVRRVGQKQPECHYEHGDQASNESIAR